MLRVSSAVGVLPVADAGDADDSDFIGDFIDDSIASDTDPPVIFRANEFPTTGRTRVLGECSDRARQLRPDFRGDPLEIFFSRALYKDLERGC